MAENKTQPTKRSVEKFLSGITPDKKREDSLVLLELMKKATGEKPQMWGDSIIGFGTYHYKYASGREGDFLMTGFSPRKQNLTVYIMPGFDRFADLMGKLGKFKISKSCLYIKNLEDVDISVLKKLIKQSMDYMIKIYK
ncbi:MAG: DUF1801 domain-containing protein [Candidatus Zixiibacteriota bacterium]